MLSNRYKIEDMPDMSGKVAVVTGGSRGIGEAAVSALVQKGCEGGSCLFLFLYPADRQYTLFPQLSSTRKKPRRKSLNSLLTPINSFTPMLSTLDL